MGAPFNVSYIVGGELNYSSPLFPTFFNDYEKGFRLDIAQGQNGNFALEVQNNCHFKGISISATGYNDGDNWDLMVGNDIVYETIYMKELGEEKLRHMNPVITTGTILTFTFHNTGPAKVVFVDLHFLQ